MLISASDYGPFGPVVGYGGAIIATGGALFTLWGGKMKKWRPPDEDLPGGAQGVVLLLCGVGMVLQWYLATPNVLKWLIAVIPVLLVLCVLCFMRYSGLLGTHVYVAKVATSANTTKDVRILGGREVLPEAEEKRKEFGVDIQTLFEGAAYKPDLLWSRESRQWVKQRVLTFFILTLVLGTVRADGREFCNAGAPDSEGGSQRNSDSGSSRAEVVISSAPAKALVKFLESQQVKNGRDCTSFTVSTLTVIT